MGRKSLINRRAAKAADNMWRKSGMFSGGNARSETRTPYVHTEPPIQSEKKDTGDCSGYIPEKDNCSPLRDNPACEEKEKCNLSVHCNNM